MKYKEGYGVGIPTLGRDKILLRTVEAFLRQTRPPGHIIIIDNNPGDHAMVIDAKSSTSQTEVLCTKGKGKKSDASGSQQALGLLSMLGYRTAVKWDDDLIPELDCMEHLVCCVGKYGCVARGGLYPRTGETRATTIRPVDGVFVDAGGRQITYPGYYMEAVVPDGTPSHIQFFHWDSVHGHWTLNTPALYSSFAYSIPDALLLGGFCTSYSSHSYRHETDFTLRLAKVGQLRIDTKAKAEHLLAPGGLRTIDEKEARRMREHDQELFERRMESFGISPTDWREGVRLQ